MILVVEDELVSRRALTSLLQGSGYATEAVETAEDALRMVAAGRVPDVVLVDLDLPGMNGIELISHFGEHHPTVQSVLITAASRDKVDRIQHDYGVPYVRKPVDFRQLLILINQKQMRH